MIMTTESMVEWFLEEGRKAFKRNYGKSKEARCLDRHEAVEYHGQIFHYWKELVVYTMCEYIQEKIPNADIQMILDGNDSTIELSMTDDERIEINRQMYLFIDRMNSVDNKKIMKFAAR